MTRPSAATFQKDDKQHRAGGEATREALLETAIDLVWRSNYDKVGVADICSAAGVTKGAFYHHFESKEELYYEASKHHWHSLQRELDAVFSPQLSPLEQVHALVAFMIRKQREVATDEQPMRGCPFFISGAQDNGEDSLLRKAADEMIDCGARYYGSLVRGLHAEGLLEWSTEPNAEDLARVARHLQCYFQGLLLYGQVKRCISILDSDLKDGLYRLLQLKQEYRS